MKKLLPIYLTLLTLFQLTRTLCGMAISLGHCEKNISIKYQVPVMRTRPLHVAAVNDVTGIANAGGASELYIDYEERVRWDIILVCCPGYRTIIFGLCEAICNENCPQHSHCAEPNKCKCSRGYEPSHHPNKQHQLICRPSCGSGCPPHSHCVSPNVCECRAGYRDVSTWFSAKRCERVHCGPEQRYDTAKHSCVRIEMSMEELMQRVGQRLENGIQSSEDDDEDGAPDDEVQLTRNTTVLQNQNVQQFNKA